MNSPDATEVKYASKYLQQQCFIAHCLIPLDSIYCQKKRPQNLNNMQLHYYLLLSKMFICEETRNIIYSIRFYVAYRLCYKVSFNPHKIKEQGRI